MKEKDAVIGLFLTMCEHHGFIRGLLDLMLEESQTKEVQELFKKYDDVFEELSQQMLEAVPVVLKTASPGLQVDQALDAAADLVVTVSDAAPDAEPEGMH